jgi:hypothetical protein
MSSFVDVGWLANQVSIALSSFILRRDGRRWRSPPSIQEEVGQSSSGQFRGWTFGVPEFRSPFPCPVSREVVLQVGEGVVVVLRLSPGLAGNLDEKLDTAVFLVGNRKRLVTVAALVVDVLEAREEVREARATQKAA